VITISDYMLEEKNKVSSGTVTMVLLEITIPGSAIPARICSNNEDITWRSETWQAFPFQFDEIGESSKGEIPRVDISISNVNQVMENYIQAYDTYTKINGYTAIMVSIFVVNSGYLADTNPEVEYLFELQDARSGPQWAVFTLSAPSPYNQRYPLQRMMKNHCQVRKFKDVECGYVGVATVCDRTLATCRTFNNSGRFRACPGAGNTVLRI